ncbi:MAG: NUDIX hydrolase [Vulcanimicrobiota bacterium]
MSERTLESRRVFEGKLISVDVLKVELEDGSQTNREIVLHPDAVCAVVVSRERQVALVKQYRKPLERAILEIPAGKIDAGESPDTAIVRELREEVGYLSGNIRKLTDFYTSPGFCNEKLTLYLAEDVEVGEPQTDEGEFIENVWVSLPEAVEMALDGRLGDAKSTMGILLAARLLGA